MGEKASTSNDAREDAGKREGSKTPVDMVKSQTLERQKLKETQEKLKATQESLEGRHNYIKEKKQELDDLDQAVNDTLDTFFQGSLLTTPALRDVGLYTQELSNDEQLNRQAKRLIDTAKQQYAELDEYVKSYQKTVSHYENDAREHNTQIDKHNDRSSKEYHVEHFDVKGQYAVEHFDNATSPSMLNRKMYHLQA